MNRYILISWLLPRRRDWSSEYSTICVKFLPDSSECKADGTAKTILWLADDDAAPRKIFALSGGGYGHTLHVHTTWPSARTERTNCTWLRAGTVTNSLPTTTIPVDKISSGDGSRS